MYYTATDDGCLQFLASNFSADGCLQFPRHFFSCMVWVKIAQQTPRRGNRHEAASVRRQQPRVERQRGDLSLCQVLQARVRYFTDSVAFGSREWIEKVFERNREKLRVKRERGARVPKQPGLQRWHGLIDLRGKLS